MILGTIGGLATDGLMKVVFTYLVGLAFLASIIAFLGVGVSLYKPLQVEAPFGRIIRRNSPSEKANHTTVADMNTAQGVTVMYL